MPIYEYSCTKCGTRFEQLVRMFTPTEAIECPRCGARSAERRLSPFSAGGSAPSPSGGGCCPRGKFT